MATLHERLSRLPRLGVGISAEPEFPTTVTRWQLLNEPGFTNADNKPLAKGFVTLSTTDLISFK